jgi:hypothetical protein
MGDSAASIRHTVPPAKTKIWFRGGVHVPVYPVGQGRSCPQPSESAVPAMRYIPPSHREVPVTLPRSATVVTGATVPVSDPTADSTS